MDDGLALLEAQPAQHPVHALRAENAHQVVFERDEELGRAGVALPPGASAKLVVDPPAFMALGGQHIEAAGLDHHPLVLRDLLQNRSLARLASVRISISALPPSWISVPRPAMLVAIVTAPGLPACAMIAASCSW